MPQQPISNVKALSVLHFSLFIGQIMFAGIAAYLIYSKNFTLVVAGKELLPVIGGGVVGISVALVIAAFAMFKKKIENIRTSADGTAEKLSRYRATSIIRWAMLEAPTLLVVIAFLLTGQQVLLMVAAVQLMIFYYTKPTAAKVAQDLGISDEEVQ